MSSSNWFLIGSGVARSIRMLRHLECGARSWKALSAVDLADSSVSRNIHASSENSTPQPHMTHLHNYAPLYVFSHQVQWTLFCYHFDLLCAIGISRDGQILPRTHWWVILTFTSCDYLLLVMWLLAGTAVGKLLTLGGVGIWWIVDVILLVTGELRPADDSSWIPYY